MFYMFYVKNCIKCHFVRCFKRNNFRFYFIHKFFLIKFILSVNMKKIQDSYIKNNFII